MFDLDFDHPGGPHAAERMAEPETEDMPEEEEEALPPPTFTEEELQLAREAAYEEGRQAAIAEALELSERLTALAMTNLSDQMPNVFRQQEEANDANARAASRVALAVLKKVLPAACERYAFEEVTRVVEDVVGHLLDEPRIIVKAAQPLVEAVRERLEAVCAAHGFEGRVVVQADARLSPGDCRVEWADGGAERDQARLMADIEAAIERSLAPPERRVEDHGEFAGT